jgi:hypothetical protein
MTTARNASAAALGLLAYTASSVALAALPADNRFPQATDWGYPAIHFDNVAVEYKPGKTKGKVLEDNKFFATSTPSTTLTLMGPGYDGVTFSGDFILDAFISPKGALKSGTFGFYSSDAMFAGAPTANYGCNNAGKNCETGYLVYGGDLQLFGWSENYDLSTSGHSIWANANPGMLEFRVTNQSGWAWDLWGSGFSENIIMNIAEGLNLNGANSVTSWTGTADGIAVVPVPAAVWLLGSGLVGLFGISKRKRSQQV